MPVTRQQILNAATVEQRAQLRAQAVAESDTTPSFVRGDYTITVTSGPTPVGRAVSCVLRVVHTASGKVVPLSNPFVFVNPPTSVPSGTFHTETIGGQSVQVPNYSFAPQQAFRQALVDAVEDAIRRIAWRP